MTEHGGVSLRQSKNEVSKFTHSAYPDTSRQSGKMRRSKRLWDMLLVIVTLNKPVNESRVQWNVCHFHVADQIFVQLRIAIHHQLSDFSPSGLQGR